MTDHRRLTPQDAATEREPVMPEPRHEDERADRHDGQPHAYQPTTQPQPQDQQQDQDQQQHQDQLHQDQRHEDRSHQDQLEEPPYPEPVELSAVTATPGDAPLFTGDDAADYQAEWRALQADFVDDPREAVQRADELVAQVMQALATTFAEHKHSLEGQWQQGDEVQTEELRQALKRYRSFFDRLLAV